MRDLTDVLGAAVEARAQALDRLAPAAGLAGLRTRVRRRRAVRHTVEAVAVLPVVAGVVVGGWLLLGDRDPVPPVVSPTPTSTPTEEPGPDPTPSPSPSPEIALGDLIVEPGLPPYYAMPDGLLEQATSGWVLAVYEPTPWFPAAAPTTAVVVVASPDGFAYEVARWDPRAGQADGSWVVTDLLDWRGGGTTALVTQTVVSADGLYAGAVVRELDLLTGVVRDVGGHEDDELVAAGDTVRAWHDATAQTLTFESPSGTLTLEGEPWSRWVTLGTDERYALVQGSVPRVLDVASGEAVGPTMPDRPEGWCTPVSWWTASSLLLECLDQDPGAWEGLTLELHPRLVTLPLGAASDQAGTQILALGLGDPEPWQLGNAWVADGVVVVQAARVTEGLRPYIESCADGAYLLRDGAFTELPRTDARDFINLFGPSAAGGRIVVESTGGCSGDSAPSVITGYDPADLSATVMLGLPAGDESTPGGTSRWWDGPASWVVGR